MRRAGVLVVVGLVLAFAAAPAPASAAGSNHAPGPPSSLTVDEDAMPLWVTDDPLFGWQVNDADRGEVQSAYEIVVYDGAPADASHLLADTGRVSTDRQTFVDVAGLAAKLAPDHLPDEHAARFDTSDGTLNAVWTLARHSALYDPQEQFVDTPTREKGPFLGDSFDVSQATEAAFGERQLTFQGLRDFARSQARYWPDGRVNVVYPNGDGKRDIPVGTQTYVEWVWQNWMTTGNLDELAALYPTVRNITDYVARAIDPATGLVTNLPGGGSDYQYGAVDWPPWMRYGYDMKTAARTMMNVLAVDDFQRVAAMGRALGKPSSEIAREQERADALGRSIHQRLTRPDGVLIDGLYANGTQSTHASQQANAWAMAFGLVPPPQVATVADHLVALKNAMGVVYFRVLLDALHVAGRDQALVDALTDPKRPGYAQILQRGATFTWESWIAPDVGDSESHGWGATVLAVLQDDILGVRATAPGGAQLDVRVPATSVTRAGGVVVTERGRVPVSWTRDAAGHETVDVTIPTNVTANVHLPVANAHGASDDGVNLVGDPGVSAVHTTDGALTLTVGSGHYRFTTSAPTRSATGASSSSLVRPVVVIVVVLGALTAGTGVVVRRRRRAA